MKKKAKTKIQKPDPRVNYPGVRVYLDYGKFYHFIPVPGKRHPERLHRLLWIEKHGPIPKGMLLTCKTEDTMNVDPNNWELISKQDLCERIRKFVHNTPEPIERTCKCGNKFITNNSKRIKCDQCQSRRNPEIEITCCECGTVFKTSMYHKKTCSDKCANDRQLRQTRESHNRNKKQKQERKPKAQKLAKERISVDDIRELNRNAPTNDREIIERKGIESPDLSQVEYKYFDKKLKITRFFKSKKRYEEFMAEAEKTPANS